MSAPGKKLNVRGSGRYAVRAATVQTLRPHFETLLRPQERQVLELRYCGEHPPHLSPTIETIAAQIGVCRSRAAQIEKTGLLRLGIDIPHRTPRCLCAHAIVAHRWAPARDQMKRRDECRVPGCDCIKFRVEVR